MGTTLRHLHRYMTQRSKIQLDDGRVGSIVRVDTAFPANETTVTLWTPSANGPGVAKVNLRNILGEIPRGSGEKKAG